MKPLIALLLLTLLPIAAQAQNNYTQAIRQGDAALRRGEYKTAIKKYFAAEAFDPSKKEIVQKKVETVFDRIESLRAETDKARITAEENLEKFRKEERAKIECEKVKEELKTALALYETEKVKAKNAEAVAVAAVTEYYNISVKYINEKFEDKLALIQNDTTLTIAERQKEIQELAEAKDDAIKNAEELSRKMSEINLDEAPDIQKQAMMLFREGKIDSAINILSDDAINYRLQQQINSAQVNQFMLLADLYELKENFDSVEHIYYVTLRFDTIDIENLFKIGNFFLRQNKFSTSIDVYERILKNEIGDRIEIKVLNKLTEAYLDVNNFDKSREVSEKARSLIENNRTLRDLLPEFANTLINLGVSYQKSSEFEKAINAYNEAIDILRGLEQAYLPDLSRTFRQLGTVYSTLGNYAEAERYLKESIDILRELPKDNSGRTLADLAITLKYMGDVMSSLGRFDQVEVSLSEALAIQKQLVETNPDAYLPGLPKILTSVGYLYTYINDFSKAESLFLEALQIQQSLVHKDSFAYLPDVALTLIGLGSVYMTHDYPSKAVECLETALDITLKIFGEKDFNIFPLYVNLGIAYFELRNYEKSIYHTQKAARKAIEVLGPNHPLVFRAFFNLGQAYASIDDNIKAIEYFEKIESDNSIAFGYGREINTVYQSLGELYNKTGTTFLDNNKIDSALTAYKKSFINAEASRDTVLWLSSIINLSTTFQKLNQCDSALVYIDRGINIAKNLDALDPQIMQQINFNKAVCLHRLGKTKDASAIFDRLKQEAILSKDNVLLEKIEKEGY